MLIVIGKYSILCFYSWQKIKITLKCLRAGKLPTTQLMAACPNISDPEIFIGPSIYQSKVMSESENFYGYGSNLPRSLGSNLTAVCIDDDLSTYVYCLSSTISFFGMVSLGLF